MYLTICVSPPRTTPNKIKLQKHIRTIPISAKKSLSLLWFFGAVRLISLSISNHRILCPHIGSRCHPMLSITHVSMPRWCILMKPKGDNEKSWVLLIRRIRVGEHHVIEVSQTPNGALKGFMSPLSKYTLLNVFYGCCSLFQVILYERWSIDVESPLPITSPIIRTLCSRSMQDK